MADQGEENLQLEGKSIPKAPQLTIGTDGQARDFVNQLPKEVVKSIEPLAHIERQLHTGQNFSGERLSPEDRRVLEKTVAHLKEKIMKKYHLETPGELVRFMEKTKLFNRYVAADLANRYQAEMEKNTRLDD